jgi:hypothetical protein
MWILGNLPSLDKKILNPSRKTAAKTRIMVIKIAARRFMTE